jgi:murein DD-endopeptidase MepM/ murein hydrolase activator NlpD
MSVVTNIKAMSSGIGDLNKQVKDLLGNVKSLAGVTAQSLGGVKGMLMGGGARGLGFGSQGNVMGGSLAGFSTPAGLGAAVAMGGTGQAVGGLAQMAIAPVTMAYGATMDSSGIVNRASTYNSAALMSGTGNRTAIAKATFSALRGGLTGVGSDAQVASILAGSGYTAGTANYLGAAAQVGGAARYLNMGNQQASAAIAGMQSGAFAANAYQYGITTMNADGSFKSTGDISKQIMKTFMPTDAKGNSLVTGKKVTAETINTSFLKGNLGPILEGLGLSADQQQLVRQAMVDTVSGKNPDLASKTSAGNPASAAQRMNASQTMIQQASEKNTIKGLDAAAATTELFNNSMKDVISSMALFKGYLDGMSGTNAGKGIKAGGKSLLSGAKNFLVGAGKVVLGGAMIAAAGVTDVATLGAATPLDLALAAGGAATIASGVKGTKGGGRPGYGGSFGAKGGGTPGSPISGMQTAGYGAVDTSGIWASTGNQHKGVDYAAPLGTPVHATMPGIVSGDSISSDYGNAVLIDHPNGYSTLYAHLKNKEVSPGSQVSAGQEIGKVGQSGNTTGPSLHYEVRKGKNNPVNPAELGAMSGSPLGTAITMSNKGSKNAKNSGASLKIGGAPAGSNLAATDAALLSVLQKAGFTGDALTNAYNVAKSESGGRPGALNPNASSGDYSMGLFQINMIGSLGTARNAQYLKQYKDIGYKGPESLYDPAINAKIAYDISKGGTKWSDAWVNTSRKLGIGGGTPGYGASVDSPVATDTVLGAATVNQGTSNSKNVYITVKIDQANEASAITFAKKVQSILDNKNNNHLIGSS